MLKTKRKGLKIILLILFFIVIILGIGVIIINNNINSIVSDKFNQNFEDSEYYDYYNFSFQNLHINILTGTIKFSDVYFTAKTNVDTSFFYKNGKFNIEIKDYILKGADIYKYIKTDTLDVNLIKIIEPKFSFIRYIKNPEKDVERKIIMSPFVDVKKIKIVNANLYNENRVNSTTNNLENISIEINNLQYKGDSVSRNVRFANAIVNLGNLTSKTKHNQAIEIANTNIDISDFNLKVNNDTILYSFDNFDITLNNLKTSTKNNEYDVSTSKLLVSITNNTIEINDFKLKPNLSKEKFAKIHKYQKEMFDFEIDSIKVDSINFDSLIYKQSVLIKNIIINGGVANIYKDKTYPLDSNKFPLLPNQQILEMPLRIDIGKITTENIKVNYSQKNSPNKIGFVDLKFNTSITNISNINTNKPLKIIANGKIHNTANFNINLDFIYNVDGFSYKGKIASFNIVDMNDIITSFVSVKAKKGDIHKIIFSGYAGKDVSIGNMTFAYNNLKLKVLNENIEHKKDKYKNGLLSFTANTIIQTNNPISKKAELKSVEFIFEKDKNRGLFNYLLKSVLAGVSVTVLSKQEEVKKYKAKLTKLHQDLWNGRNKKKH